MTTKLSEEVLETVEKSQPVAIEAARKFVDIVDHGPDADRPQRHPRLSLRSFSKMRMCQPSGNGRVRGFRFNGMNAFGPLGTAEACSYVARGEQVQIAASMRPLAAGHATDCHRTATRYDSPMVTLLSTGVCDVSGVLSVAWYWM